MNISKKQQASVFSSQLVRICTLSDDNKEFALEQIKGAFTQKEPKKSLQNVTDLVTWYLTGKLKPHIDATYSLQDAPKALEAIMNRRVKGKVVIDMEK